jgi:biopolymer transport protein ExbB/TolQ
MGLIIMKKSMKKFLFIAFVLLGIVACKEDLSEYYNRLEQREALNKRVEDDNASLEAQNVKQAAQNDNQDAENEAQALRNEEIRKWNAEQILRNAEQGILNDAMSSVLDSLLR